MAEDYTSVTACKGLKEQHDKVANSDTNPYV